MHKSGKSSLHLRAKVGVVPTSILTKLCWYENQICFTTLSFDAYSYLATVQSNYLCTYDSELGPGNRESFWALWNGIEPIGECNLGPKNLYSFQLKTNHKNEQAPSKTFFRDSRDSRLEWQIQDFKIFFCNFKLPGWVYWGFVHYTR